MQKITFSIAGEPKGKGRPRFVPNAGRVYTPPETHAYERLVAYGYRNMARGYKFTAPVRVTIEAFHKPPKGKSKKVTQAMLDGTILPTKKPDADNVAKIILDGLNHIAWDDDTQVVEMVVTKRYAEVSNVTVTIEELNAQRC